MLEAAPLQNLQATCKEGLLCPLVAEIFPNSTWAPVIAGLIDLLLIAVIALIVRRVVRKMIRRFVGRVAEGTLSKRMRDKAATIFEGSPALLTERRRQRAETIGSVLSSVASIIILGTAALMILGSLGLNLGPLLASATFIGAALGFGAQNIVKDVLAGLFMLLEDQYGVGDVIDAGPATGTVEAVTLRITRLRDVNGVVWYVRNGEITRIGNESQGWARAVLDVPVAYEADIARVRELLKETARRLWQENDEIILEEPEVWGVEALYAQAVVIRVVVKTAPLEQWRIARELRERVKQAFDHEGVAVGSITLER